MITFCSVPRKNSMVFITWASGKSYYLKWEEVICNDNCHTPAHKSHTPAHKKSIHSRTKLIFWQKISILLCKFEAEVTVPRYLQQTMSQLDPLQESHTTSNEVQAAQPSCEAEWIVGLCYEGKMNREAQPWPSPGLRGEGPGFPKVDTCPRDALDRPRTDPQYARNSSGKGLGTLEHTSLEKN